MSDYARRWASFYQRHSANGVPVSLRSVLSRRQAEIACLVADGFHKKAIAAMVDLEPQTVRLYVGKIYKRLGLTPDPDRTREAQITEYVVKCWAKDDECQQDVENFNISTSARESSAA